MPQDSAEGEDLTELAEGLKNSSNYDETDKCRRDVTRILTACKEAEWDLEVLDQDFRWRTGRSALEYATMVRGHRISGLLSGIVRLLKSLAVVLAEHRDNVKRQLQQTEYYRIFVDETSERREAVRSVIMEDLCSLQHQIKPDTYDQMLEPRHLSEYISNNHLKTYVKLLVAVDHLFRGK